MKAMILSMLVVGVADEEEARGLAAKVQEKADADVKAICGEWNVDPAAIGIESFGTTVIMLAGGDG